MGAQNKVIAGDYNGKTVDLGNNYACISTSFLRSIAIDKDVVESYEVLDEKHTKSATSAISRGLVGGLLLGPVGLLAGLSAKTKGVHVVAIQFKDGKKSLLEIDDKLYNAILKRCF